MLHSIKPKQKYEDGEAEESKAGKISEQEEVEGENRLGKMGLKRFSWIPWKECRIFPL